VRIDSLRRASRTVLGGGAPVRDAASFTAASGRSPARSPVPLRGVAVGAFAAAGAGGVATSGADGRHSHHAATAAIPRSGNANCRAFVTEPV